MTTVGQIEKAISEWAPVETAQGYDNVGLQVGDPAARVSRVLVALDLTHAVIDEAEALAAELIVTHHPLLFHPLKRLSPDRFVSGLAWRLARAGIAHIAAHTNLDVAKGGVSFALAGVLGLQDVRVLDPAPDSRVKVATFVPVENAPSVRAAMAEAGAGRIGAYEACAFESSGTGYFKPLAEARPYLGRPAGPLESVQEVRLEVEVASWRLGAVLSALAQAHPYEEVAYDIYPLRNRSRDTGFGAVGVLPAPVPLNRFLAQLADAIEGTTLRYVGAENGVIATVAVCGGAGRSLIDAAIRSGADAYVTADLGYHSFFEVLDFVGDATLALIDAGHYETERPAELLLVDRLSAQFPDLDWTRTTLRTSPVRDFVRLSKD